MLRRCVFVAWLVAIIGIVMPCIASAATVAECKTRVWGFDLVAHVRIEGSSARSAEKHPENALAYDGNASGSPLAAEGGFGARLAGTAGEGAMSATGPIRVTGKGMAIVEQHLGQFGPDAANQAMVGRLQSAMSTGTRVTGADANFYLHEVSEATMMGRGMSYPAAHGAAIGKYGVSPFSLYHPSVIQGNPTLFGPAWFTFWGL